MDRFLSKETLLVTKKPLVSISKKNLNENLLVDLDNNNQK